MNNKMTSNLNQPYVEAVIEEPSKEGDPAYDIREEMQNIDEFMKQEFQGHLSPDDILSTHPIYQNLAEDNMLIYPE